MKTVEEVKHDVDEAEANGDDEVDLYDDVLSLPVGMEDGDDLDDSALPASAGSTPTNSSVSSRVRTSSNPGRNSDGKGGDRDMYKDTGMGFSPIRKHQACIGNLTWWTSDKDITDALDDIGVTDFVEVKFYENRANGQSKGYCIVTVGSDGSLKSIHEKLSKKELHGQFPVVTPPSKQALNQFEAQAKTRPTPSGNQGSDGGGRTGPGGPGQGNMQMNMMGGGPRGPMPMQGQMNMGGMGMRMGYGNGPRMMMGPNAGPPMRGPGGMPPMGPGPGGPMPMNMGGPVPPNQNGPPGYGPPQRHMQPQNSMPPMQGPGGPRMPMMMHGGPGGPMGRGQMPAMMDQRGPPPRNDWRPPSNPEFMNNFIPHGQPQMSPPGPGPLHIRGQVPPVQTAPAPHMNPAFFHNVPGGPPQGGPFSTTPQLGGYLPPPMEHSSPQIQISEAEFEEVMGRNRTVSSSAISRAVSDAATGEFASAIETLVTAISLIKQSKVAHDDRCKILVSSLQDTLHGIEAKSYGSSRRERSRSRDRHRRSRRDRSRSREGYRDRSRERYYEYPRDRSRSREREYRERIRDEAGRGSYYDERYRERDRERERERVPARPEPERSREREHERESPRDSSHRPSRH